MRARGWLLLLCGLLTVWEPINLGLFASGVLPRILDRPAAIAVLVLRLAVTSLGVAGGIALATGKPHGVTLTKMALALSIVPLVVSLWTPYFPRNHVPGSEAGTLIAALAYNAAWYVYLSRSQQVKRLLATENQARSSKNEAPRTRN